MIEIVLLLGMAFVFGIVPLMVCEAMNKQEQKYREEQERKELNDHRVIWH